jgi:hypothetical protein
MADEKDILSKITLKLKLANNYLKDGLFDKAKDKFNELEICEEYNRAIGEGRVDALLIIPVFIHDFLCIHPFNDVRCGNRSFVFNVPTQKDGKSVIFTQFYMNFFKNTAKLKIFCRRILDNYPFFHYNYS